VTREPGGTALGEQIRDILLSHKNSEITASAELLLYQASRAQIVHEVILPALKRGEIVLCDRFTDATLAYQGYGRGLDVGVIRRLNDLATGGLCPDVTVLLDCPATLGIQRIRQRCLALTGKGLDRLEQEGLAFHERIRKGYRALAREEKGRIVLVDARLDPESVFAHIKEHLLKRLEKPMGFICPSTK
jgi:dTMP kinase